MARGVEKGWKPNVSYFMVFLCVVTTQKMLEFLCFYTVTGDNFKAELSNYYFIFILKRQIKVKLKMIDIKICYAFKFSGTEYISVSFKNTFTSCQLYITYFKTMLKRKLNIKVFI